MVTKYFGDSVNFLPHYLTEVNIKVKITPPGTSLKKGEYLVLLNALYTYSNFSVNTLGEQSIKLLS